MGLGNDWKVRQQSQILITTANINAKSPNNKLYELHFGNLFESRSLYLFSS